METTDDTKKRAFLDEFREISRILIISLLIVVPIRLFIAQPFIVRGASMEPSFFDGEYLIVDEFSYYFREPARGDAIILRYPANPKQYFIKRIVGLPGELVTISNGNVIIGNDGKPLSEDYLPRGIDTGPNISVNLKADEYFVMGDNRTNSSDSRIWGPLGGKYVVGRVIVRLWPLTRAGILTSD